MGGHGGLNILPQKSWHVYNWDNREKVKKDEQEQAEKEQAEREEQLQRDGEIRRNLLLTRARAKRVSASNADGETGQRQDEVSTSTPASGSPLVAAELQGHINLFEGLEPRSNETQTQGRGQDKGRKEGKKADEDSKEQKEAIKYTLGYGAPGVHAEKPWYLNRPASQDVSPLGESGGEGLVSKGMKRALSQPATSSGGRGPVEDKDKVAKKKRGSTVSLEELRDDRLKRERQEQVRSHQLLASSAASRLHGHGAASVHRMLGSSSRPPGNRPPRYNSGFGYGR